MTQTIKNSIIRYLESNPGPQYGGRIERAVAEIHEAKESNCGRRLRELEREGKIISEYVSNPNGRGNKVVRYSLKPMHVSENLCNHANFGALWGKDGWVCFGCRKEYGCFNEGRKIDPNSLANPCCPRYPHSQTYRPGFLKKKLFEESQRSLL